MPFCFEQNFRVYQFECDPWDRMTPGAMLRRVQEISTEQCESVGINEELYKSTHTVFLLSKISLEVYRAPMIEEEVRIETRAYGQRRATYHRVTSIHAQNGDKLCEADSRWVLVDTQNRRILRKPLDVFLPHFNEEPGEEHAMELVKADKVYPFEEMRASYMLCDRNGHVNNTKYADFVCDHLPLAQLKQGVPRKMLFVFRKEIEMDTTFVFCGAPVGEGQYYFVAQQPGEKNFEAWVAF